MAAPSGGQRVVEGFQPLTAAGADGTLEPFSYVRMEWDEARGLHVPSAPRLGADFYHDFTGEGEAHQANAIERVRFWLLKGSDLDAELNDLRAGIGSRKGKLWVSDAAAVRWWAWARPTVLPTVDHRVNHIDYHPISCEFERYSPWYEEARTDTSETLDAVTPNAWNVTNNGNRKTSNVILTLSALGNISAGWSIENTTTGQKLTVARAMVNTDVFEIDVAKMTAEFNGASDWANVSLLTTQHGVLELWAGVNAFEFAGTYTPADDSTLEVDYYEAYE